MPQVFVSWSGGKDSSLACYRAVAGGLKVRYLINMITEDGKRSWTHGQSAELLQAQSQAVGIPLVQRRTKMASYEAEFKDVLLTLRQEGITGGVFGDIDLEEHRQWIERVCGEVDITPHLPLWGERQEEVLRDFINRGFEAVAVVAKADLLGEEWLGRKIDLDFLSDLSGLKKPSGFQLGGEAGEYHTFVTDGPLFNKGIEILETQRTLRDGCWFLEILKYQLRSR
ncbi:diphthine--ammonia ligase [Chloroflexota bacterium]